MENGNDGRCFICLDTSPPPVQSGCACRGDGGLAHIDCRVQAAVLQQAQRGNGLWRQCQTCKHFFTGAMQMGLAEAWRSRVASLAAESAERLDAVGNLARSLISAGKYDEAELMLSELREVQKRVLGAEHPVTLVVAGNLATSLSGQGRAAEAEEIQRELVVVQKRVLGPEHPHTLKAGHLATVCTMCSACTKCDAF